MTALKAIEKALKPGGKAFLYFAADYGYDRIDHAINAVVARSKWTAYFTDFSEPVFLITPLVFGKYVKIAGLKL